MTTAQLAKRVGVSQPTVVAFERSEERGTIQLSTLRRLAEAMDCQVVYALMPNTPLQTAVRRRAREVHQRRLSAVAHTMRLEDQAVAAEVTEDDIESLVRETSPSRLWD